MKIHSIFNASFIRKLTFFKNTASNLRYSSGASRHIKLEKDKVERVLSILNNTGKTELMKYPISNIRVEKIYQFKMKHGKIENIEHLLELDGFGVKMLEKLCMNVLQYADNPYLSTANPPTKRSGTFTIPGVSVSSREHYKSVVSIFITVTTISWAHIKLNDDGPCDLSNWHCYELTEKRLHLSDLVQNLCQVIRMIPEADCYVMENPQIAQAAAPGGAEQVNINVQKAQVVAMLNYGLVTKNVTDFEHTRVFYLKKYLSSRVFNTLVGSERISTENVVKELMRTVYNIEDYVENGDESQVSKENNLLRCNINVPMELRTLFSNSEKYKRDFLGQALLIGMTFIRLCLIRIPESIETVTRKTIDGVDPSGSG